MPGGTATYDIKVENLGCSSDTINLEKIVISQEGTWTHTLSTSTVTLDSHASTNVQLKVTADLGNVLGDYIEIKVTGTSQGGLACSYVKTDAVTTLTFVIPEFPVAGSLVPPAAAWIALLIRRFSKAKLFGSRRKEVD